MQHFPSTPLCPVCAGSVYTLSDLYPEEKYCKEHGIAMRQYDFSRFEALFSTMSSVRTSLELFNVLGVWPIVKQGNETLVDIPKTLRDAVRAYDALRGGAI